MPYGRRYAGFLGRFDSICESRAVHEGVHGGCADAVTGGFVGFESVVFSDLELPPLPDVVDRNQLQS